MENVRAQFEATIAARAEEEATQAAEVRRRAEEELDGFYDERTDEVGMFLAPNRVDIGDCLSWLYTQVFSWWPAG